MKTTIKKLNAMLMIFSLIIIYIPSFPFIMVVEYVLDIQLGLRHTFKENVKHAHTCWKELFDEELDKITNT